MDIFFELMANNPDRAVYGFKHVEIASQQLAIETLMISDSLFRFTLNNYFFIFFLFFRAKSIEQRRKYVKLVETIRDQVI